MSVFIRRFSKCLSDSINILRKDTVKCSSNLNFKLIRFAAAIIDQDEIILYHRINQNYLTSKCCNYTNGSFRQCGMFFVSAGILSLFNLKKEDPEEEPELITIIKRGVLLIQKGEFKKAEQMLHVALKLAQEQQNYDGITYIYDLLANLAYEQEEFGKAEKLFVNVMQRLLAKEVPKTDNKVIHISLKLANIYRLQKDNRKAEEGFKFCITSLQSNIDKGSNDEDTLMLWGMTLDWYARFLVDMNQLSEAFTYFQKAYDLCVQVYGLQHEETAVLLNDLGTICFVQNEYDKAINYLTQAVAIGNKFPDMQDFGSILVNLGTVYMKKGMYKEANRYCKEAWKNAKKHNNIEVLEEASACLDELKGLETA